MTGRLIVISGPSGSGKTTIIKRLLEKLDLEFSVSATTRPARPGETDGVDYFFVSVAEFERLIEESGLLEWAIYNGNYYGTPSVPVDAALMAGSDVLLDIELDGARQVRQLRPEALMIFIAPPSLSDLENRLRGRGDTSDRDIEGRLAVASAQLEEADGLFDHIVVNDDLEIAVDQILGLINPPA